MLTKIFYILFAIHVSSCNCSSERKKSGFVAAKADYKIETVGKLPKNLNESSGLARVKGSENTYWTHNDGGNTSELYEINKKGEEISRVNFPTLPNIDWEDLAQDNNGNVFIADIGNNANNRRDLKIYKVNPTKPEAVETIGISYADQREFPPLRKDQNYDCEAVVYHQKKLYLFSKNRSADDKFVKMYVFPAEAGSYSAAPADSIYIKTMVTSADISPDGRTLALLSYGKVFLFDISEGLNFRKPTSCIKIGRGQSEAIAFVNNTDFMFTNEHQRNIYMARLR
jgi:WD40 repeat protein